MFVLKVFRNQEDWIKAVRVTGEGIVCWEIRARERVSMHGFEVKVGCVPEGFEQTVPGGQAKFILEEGKLYDIAVLLENYPRGGWRTSFRAGHQTPSNEDWKALMKDRTNNGKY
ncbi:MAG: hypothetical protein ACYS7Y_24325 [Planctomycetota bacterium]|jgi:hypothetical protein